jgi:hypothetical protein
MAELLPPAQRAADPVKIVGVTLAVPFGGLHHQYI